VSRISVVVPVYCNAASLRDLHEKLKAVAASSGTDDFEFLFVDDGSVDDSWRVLCELRDRDPRVHLVRLSRNFGSNQALRAGLAHASGDAVATLAADLQDPPEIIPEMLGHWRQGRRVVLAARRSRADPGLTAFFADSFYALFRRFAIANMPTRGFDFFLIDRSVCDIVNGIQENNTYLMGLILWLGFDPVCVSYDRAARATRYGRSRWTGARKVNYFVDSFVAFSFAPLRAASLLGLAIAALGAFYAGLVIVLRLTRGFEVQGWASLMVALLVLSGVQLFVTGVLGEYLWRTLDETRRRPRFIVQEVRGPKQAVPRSEGSGDAVR
jgi:dolichol-phosphate mannosyltransferase